MRIMSLVCTLLLVACAIASHPQAPTVVISIIHESVDGKDYLVHLVKKGETMYSICKAYALTEDEVKKANPGALISGLGEGQKLLIPVKNNKTSSSYIPQTHTVAKGETIYGICKFHGLEVAELLQLNPEAKSGIEAGQILIIDKAKLSAGRPVAPESQPAKATATTHAVKPSETIYSICSKYSIDQKTLEEANPLLKDGLKVGQTLFIPLAKQTPSAVSNLAPATKKTGASPATAPRKHLVVKGETIYSIARDYHISHTDLLADNPTIQEGLKPGMVLAIGEHPAGQKASPVVSAPVATQSTNFVVHSIEPGETLYALARLHGCTVKDIEGLNPGIDFSRISVGTEIKIPSNKDSQAKNMGGQYLDTLQRTSSKSYCDSLYNLPSGAPIRVAFVLPFYQTANDTLNARDAATKHEPRMFGKSVPFIEFYQGALMALDSLKREGISVIVKTFDSAKDSLAIKKTIESLSKQDVDLIVGPPSQADFEQLARFAQDKSIPIVSPLSTNVILPTNYNTTILANTPQKNRVEAEALFLKNEISPLVNFVIVFNGHVDEYDRVDKIKQFMLPFFKNETEMNTRLKVIKFTTTFMKDVEANFADSGKNVIVIPSEDQGFITDVLTKLYQFQKRYAIELHGMAVWETYKNIELDYLYDFNFHFVTSNFRDYKTPLVKQFVMRYRGTFNSEPSKLSFQGFDVAYYFVKTMSKLHRNFMGCVDYYPYNGLQTSFAFSPLFKGSGLVNENVNIVEYSSDYKRKIVPFSLDQERTKYEEAMKAKGIKQQIDARQVQQESDQD